MPLKLTVGRSIKRSENYNSKGYSINLDVELPADALGKPSLINESAEQLFALCDRLLEDQLIDRSNGAQATSKAPRSNGRNGGNGHTTSRVPRQETRGLTNAQERAIQNMARRLEQDPDSWAHDQFGVDGVKNLSVKQASEFIDLLKQEIEAPAVGVSR